MGCEVCLHWLRRRAKGIRRRTVFFILMDLVQANISNNSGLQESGKQELF
jgi:hypothetical protein